MDQLRKCFDSCLKCSFLNKFNKINPNERINAQSFVNNTNSVLKSDVVVVRTQPKHTQTSPIHVHTRMKSTSEASLSISKSDYFIPKVLLLGSNNVGKTSIINKCLYNDFRISNDKFKKSTSKIIEVYGQNIEFSLIDINNQDNFQVLLDNKVRQSDGFMLVFDMTNRESFESLDYYRESLLRIKYSQMNYPVTMLIGNKCDLVDERKVSQEEAENRARQYDVPYIETSALMGDNIEQAFAQLLLKIMITKDTEDLNESIELKTCTKKNQSLPENLQLYGNQTSISKQINVTFFSAQSLVEHFSKRLRSKESNVI